MSYDADVPNVEGMTDRTALITGASRGLGRALARALSRDGWELIITARGADALGAVARDLPGTVTALAGDVADPGHRAALVGAAHRAGGLDLLVNNASTLGSAPLPPLAGYPLEDLRTAFETNTIAPLALIQDGLPLLRERRGAVLCVSSDAAVEAYAGWGGYGATKAALDHLARVLAAEEPDVAVWSVDPGEMRTEMLRAAMPAEDLSGTPAPESVVPALTRLIDDRLADGRYRVAELRP